MLRLQIKVKLFATFRDGRGKEVFYDVEPRTEVKDILKKLEIKEEEVAILLINGRDGQFNSQLNEGDYISLFPPVGGG